jgi:lichenan operon transcriptional antiterminator
MQLNNRLKEIIKELVSNDGPVTSDYLSKMVGVTPRTIRNDIRALNLEFKKIGMKIEAVRGVGYFISPKLDHKDKELIEELFQLNEQQGSHVPVSPEERVIYILKSIIMADDYITIEQLANQLFVSKSTVDNDLKQVEELLNKYEVTLVKKPNFGIKVIGDEMKIRFCLSNCLSNMKNAQSQQEIGFDNPTILNGIDIDFIKSITRKQIEYLPFKLAELSFNNLIIHIAIAIQRIKKGKYIEFDSFELSRIKEQQEYSIAQNIVQSLEEAFSIKIPKQEIAYIAIHLLGAKQFHDRKLLQDDFIKLIGETNFQLVKDILSEINRVYQINLNYDNELIYGLGLHLRSAMNRMRYKMNLRNPMLNEIKNNFPFSFELAIVASKVIQRKYAITINEDEIGYIAIHLAAAIERIKNVKRRKVKRVAVVCASGMGTAKLLAASIESKFPGLEIVGTYPSFSIKEIENDAVDLILSTVPIKEERTTPILHIHSLLTDKDVEKVNEYISRKYLNDEKSFKKLQNLFSEELFFPEIDKKDPIDIIKSMAYILNIKGYVDDSFLDSVLEREEISPTSIGNLVAIPHPVKPNALNSCVAIGIMKKPVKWGEHHVQLVLLLALNDKDKDKYSDLFNQLWLLVQDKKLVADLCKSSDFAQFIKRLEKSKITQK